MKKIYKLLCIVLAIEAVFFLVACSSKGKEPNQKENNEEKTSVEETDADRHPEEIIWIQSKATNILESEFEYIGFEEWDMIGNYFGGNVLPEKIKTWTLNKERTGAYVNKDKSRVYKFLYENEGESQFTVCVEKTDSFQLYDENFAPAYNLIAEGSFDPQTVSVIESLQFLLVEETETGDLFSQLVKIFPDPIEEDGGINTDKVDDEGNPYRIILTIISNGDISKENIVEITTELGCFH